MPSPITQKDIDAVANLKVFIFVDSLFLGISEPGEHPFEINRSVNGQGSATSGDNGHYLSKDNGSHVMFTPKVHGLNKNALVEMDGVLFSEDGYFPLNATDPFAGRVLLKSKPDILDNYPIVIKPEFVEKSSGTRWTTEVDNPLTMLLPRSALVNSVTVPNNSNEVIKVEYGFKGHVDLLNDNRFGLIGPGIDTDGSIENS
jgi:hypothetical protein